MVTSKAPKYVLVPGEIISKSDGDIHYIGVARLMELYKVRSSECFVKYNDERDLGKNFDGLIPLRPRYDGNYEVPK